MALPINLKEGFAERVDRYRDAVFGIAYYYLGNFEDAEDAAQEAFVQAYLRIDQLHDPERFGPWLRKIAVNLCISRLRRRCERPLSLDAMEGYEIPGSASPDREVLRWLMVQDALSSLSEKTRQAMILFYMNGYSYHEVAEFLEIPVGTVRSRLRLAKKRLKEEMRSMVDDVLNDGKPDPSFARRVVEEALRRGDEAIKAYANGEALTHYDEALEALTKAEPDRESQRLRMEALWKKADATAYPLQEEKRLLREESLKIAESLDDDVILADKLMEMGLNARNGEEGMEYNRKALDLYQKLGNAAKRAECLMWMGGSHFFNGNVERGRSYYEQALPLLEEVGSYDYAAVCRAFLDLFAEFGLERMESLTTLTYVCEVLEKKNGILSHIAQPGSGKNSFPKELAPRMIMVGEPMLDLTLHRKMLDTAIKIGEGWFDAWQSYSYSPSRAEMRTLSDTEIVETPTGVFENCLLMEIRVEENDAPDDAPEFTKTMNRMLNYGVRSGWYAPGIGLVQVRKRMITGSEVLMQLQSYEINEESGDYFPLAVGNAWTWGWTDAPAGWKRVDRYRVERNDGDRWYVTHHGYMISEETPSE